MYKIECKMPICDINVIFTTYIDVMKDSSNTAYTIIDPVYQIVSFIFM